MAGKNNDKRGANHGANELNERKRKVLWAVVQDYSETAEPVGSRTIARKYNLVTNFGKLMDPIADKLLFCSAFIMMTYLHMLNPILCIIFVGREIIVSGFRLVTANSGKIIAANWLGKLKSGLQVVAILATLLGNPIFSRWNFPFDFGLMCTAAVFTIWSAVDYIVANRDAVNWN